MRLGRKEEVKDVAPASDLVKGEKRSGFQGAWEAMGAGGHWVQEAWLCAGWMGPQAAPKFLPN